METWFLNVGLKCHPVYVRVAVFKTQSHGVMAKAACVTVAPAQDVRRIVALATGTLSSR